MKCTVLYSKKVGKNEEIGIVKNNLELAEWTLKWIQHNKCHLNRKISPKQINPVQMAQILDKLAQGKSISQIAREMNFSRKAIQKNLKKSIEIKTINATKKTKKKWFTHTEIWTVKEVCYSLEKWLDNWKGNSINKKEIWELKIKKRFWHFIEWWEQFRLKIEKTKIKPSVDVLLNEYSKFLETCLKTYEIPSKQTIYNWIQDGKFGFRKKYFIKLSKGLYERKKSKSTTPRVYYDNSKSILEFKNDMNNKPLLNAYEIDLVKGKVGDKYAILTCLNKATRKLYSKIAFPNSEDVKEKLMMIIQENNLKIDQLIIDNGPENVLLHEIESIGQIYRCRPYCSSDKGQIENVHRLLRYWIEKGKSIDSISQIYLDWVVEQINNYPRRVLISGKLISANQYSNLISI